MKKVEPFGTKWYSLCMKQKNASFYNLISWSTTVRGVEEIDYQYGIWFICNRRDADTVSGAADTTGCIPAGGSIYGNGSAGYTRRSILSVEMRLLSEKDRSDPAVWHRSGDRAFRMESVQIEAWGRGTGRAIP